MRTMVRSMVAGAAAVGLAAGVWAAAPADDWDLTVMYADEAAAVTARDAAVARIGELEGCRGRLGEAAELARCLDLYADLDRELMTVYVYSYLNLDRDLRRGEAQKLKAETGQARVELAAAGSWIGPEVVALGRERIEAMLAAEPALADHAVGLRDTVRRAAHVLPPAEEALLATVGGFSGKFSDIYDQLTVSDMAYPTVEIPGAGPVRLNQAAYVRYRASDDRDVRRRVFDAFWDTFGAYRNTLGTVLDAEVQKNWTLSRLRGYDSTLAASLDGPDVPVEVYENLIRDVRANLPTLHRVLELRARMLGLPDQTYADIYASIVPAVPMRYPWPEAREILPASMAPLGAEYQAVLREGLASWVDVHPADGKQNGAYTIGRWYDGHPWVMLNHDDSYASLSTAAHEYGHAMHSYLSNAHQPYETSEYSGVVAEVASTFNEILLNHELLRRENDPMRRLALLTGMVERMRQTVFRQTMFAEFQLEIHRRVEAGEALTGEELSALYLQLLREYHGHARGVMEVPERYAAEWAFIPHFYMGYYVYQYATGFIASTALAEQVLAGEDGAVERYLGFLRSGSVEGPIETLRKAGADLTTDRPTALFMASMDRMLDEIDSILASQAAGT